MAELITSKSVCYNSYAIKNEFTSSQVTGLSTIESDGLKLLFLSQHKSESTNNTAPSDIPSKNGMKLNLGRSFQLC